MGNQSEIKKNFGKRAAKYRKSATHGNPDDLLRMIKLLKPQPDAIALDVATGGGHTAVALAKHVQKVIAIDITPEMQAEAAIQAGNEGAANIEFQICDVHNLPFASGRFDLVTSRFAPHHFYNIKTALQEMCRVLKPGGLLYILDCSVFDGEETDWFERMEVEQSTRQEIFRILSRLSAEAKALYPYGENYITTYRFELLAIV